MAIKITLQCLKPGGENRIYTWKSGFFGTISTAKGKLNTHQWALYLITRGIYRDSIRKANRRARRQNISRRKLTTFPSNIKL